MWQTYMSSILKTQILIVYFYNTCKFVCMESLTSLSTIFKSSWVKATMSWVLTDSRESMCLAQGQNMAPVVGMKPWTSLFRVQCTASSPTCSPTAVKREALFQVSGVVLDGTQSCWCTSLMMCLSWKQTHCTPWST